jgi:cytochrome c peroxidase
VLVACLGIGTVIEYDALSATPNASELRRWSVASGPTGIAIDPKRGEAVVWSQFEQTVNVIDLRSETTDDAHTSAVTHVGVVRDSSMVGALALGRTLFHSVANPKISRDGRTCASCHPGGRDDGLTWSTPNGPRQTPILAERVRETGPYGWEGAGSDLRVHLTHTFQRLGGLGISERETEALMAYVGSMQLPKRGVLKETRRVERGRQLFHSSSTECVSCHTGSTFSDGRPHDVGSKARADIVEKFDTPSLVAIASSAPYFHDGRFESLEDMLLATHGKMGRTSHLSKRDLNALIAYLETL